MPGIWTDEQVASWREVTQAVHSKGSFIFLQLVRTGAMGRQLASSMGATIQAPETADVPDKMGKLDFERMREDYVKASMRAIDAGFDGVELHACNGDVLQEFLSINYNTRTDEYGGSINGHARFVLEVIDSIIKAIGVDRIALRVGPYGTQGNMTQGISPIPQYSYLVSELERRAQEKNERLAYLHLIEPRAKWHGEEGKEEWEPDYSLSDFVRQIWTGPLVRCGMLGKRVDEFVEKDERTLVAVGRSFISNPDLVRRIQDGLPFEPYDRPTFYRNPAFPPCEGLHGL